MICNIIACGESGAQWDGRGDSIGVNDCFKFGKSVDYLMILDPINRFKPERMTTIKATNPKHFLTLEKRWLIEMWKGDLDLISYSKNKQLFCTNGPEIIDFRFSRWKGKLSKDRIYYSRTSPFAALSLAYILNYKEINLYGADFQTHQTWNPNNPMMREELLNYRELIDQLIDNGIKVNWNCLISL